MHVVIRGQSAHNHDSARIQTEVRVPIDEEPRWVRNLPFFVPSYHFSVFNMFYAPLKDIFAADAFEEAHLHLRASL
jgi:hypothetical protein